MPLGGGGDPDGNGQNPQALLGKIIRLDVHGDDFPGDPARNYIVPSDNLFVDIDGDIFELTPNTASSNAGDTIDGLAGDDAVHGGAGNDAVSGGGGNDVLYGASETIC